MNSLLPQQARKGEDDEEDEGDDEEQQQNQTRPSKQQQQLVDPAVAEAASGKAQALEKFFNDIERVKGLIGRIKSNTQEIQALQDEALCAVGSEAEQQVSMKLATVLTQCNKDAALCKRLLEALKTETSKMDKKRQAAEIRVRNQIHAQVLQSLVQAVRANQSAQQEYKSRLQDKNSRVIRVVKPDATEEEVRKVMETGDASTVYQTAILEPGMDPIAQAYLHVMDKHQDVLRLEKSVNELHDMFLDLANLVEAQGEMLDNIEHQVNMAKDYMQSGNTNLQGALKARKATRHRMCCCIVVLVIVLAIILGPILSSI